MRPRSPSSLLICALLASACPALNEGEGVADDGNGGAVPFTCAVDSDCVARELCLSGVCVVATCEPPLEEDCDAGDADGSHCCADGEVCSPVTFTCEAEVVDAPPCDPTDITCVQCESQSDCSAGEICSSGLCIAAAGRDACTASFQCADTDHCDREAFLCVPKRPCGACSVQLPHLCCFDDELCVDAEAGGVCIVSPPPECDTDDDCAAGLFCGSTRQCVQCDDTNDCGPGLTCDVEAGACV